ncbi:hypothetical protein PBS_19210 [Paraburkholderia sp. 2C]
MSFNWFRMKSIVTKTLLHHVLRHSHPIMTTSADSPAVPTAFATINWPEADGRQSARWRSEAGVPPPKRIVLADHHTTADSAYRLAREGTALLWRGDFQNARQLLQAMTRRLERKPPERASSPLDAFILHRQAQSQRTRTHARSACC